jgi:hypothetical protein
MPIATAVAGNIKGWPGTNGAIRAELAQATTQLQFADLFRGPGEIAHSGNVRIDVQGPWTAGPGNNIQAQIGGISIAALRIAFSLGAAAGPLAQGAVVQAAQEALNAGGRDGSWRNMTGTSP